MKILNHPGASSDDMKDFINPTIKRKPDILIIHVGSNDISKEVDTMANLQTIINRVKKKSANTTLAISSIITRYDQPNIDKKVENLNNDIKVLCEENLISYICNNNVDISCLGKAKFHPNKKGKAYMAKNFINFISTNVQWDPHVCHSGETEYTGKNALSLLEISYSNYNNCNPIIADSDNVYSVCPYISTEGASPNCNEDYEVGKGNGQEIGLDQGRFQGMEHRWGSGSEHDVGEGYGGVGTREDEIGLIEVRDGQKERIIER